MSKLNVAFGVTGLVGFSAIVTSLFMIGCSAKVEVKSTPTAASAPVVATSAPEVKAELPPIDAQLDAILRADSRISKICYDPEPQKGVMTVGWLVKYSSGVQDDVELSNGWHYIDKTEFSKTAAGSYYTEQQDPLEYLTVYPDIGGLTCKTQ